MGVYGSGAYGAGPYGGGKTKENVLPAFGLSPIVLVEVEYPSGEFLRVAGTNARFNGKHYLGKLTSLGRVERVIQKTLGIFEMTSVAITVADIDQVSASATRPIKGAIATVKVGDSSMIEAEYQTLTKGKIDDFGIEEASFRLVIKDTLFDFPEEPLTGIVSETDFPNAPDQFLGFPLPVCYGVHSVTTSDNAQNRGAWPTIYIDNRISFKTFLIANHWVKEINEVYSLLQGINTILVEGTDYTAVRNGYVNGHKAAYLSFTDTQFLAELTDINGNLADVRVNVDGKMNPDGSLMANPVDVLNDFLAEYCGGPPIDSTMFALAKFAANDLTYTVRGGYTDKNSTAKTLQEMTRSHMMRLFTSRGGGVSVSIMAPSLSSISQYREERDMLDKSWSIDHNIDVEGAEDAQIVNKVNYQSDFHHGAKKYFASDSFQDEDSLSAYGEKELTADLPWADKTTAKNVAQAIIFQFRNPIPSYIFKTPMRGVLLELTEQIGVSQNFGAEGEALEERVCEVLSLSFDPSNMSVTVKVQDIEDLVGGGFLLNDEDLVERTSTGTATVANGDATVTIAAGPADLSAVAQVGDQCEIIDPTNEVNRLVVVVAAPITATTFEAEDSDGNPVTGWTNEGGIDYRIMPSWITATVAEQFYGHLCDDTAEQFSNGDAGKVFLP